jgi:methyl coenzyme M reductase subunit C
VLEKVLKARYEILSKNFAETSATLERLACESVKEMKKKKKIVKDYNSLWRVAMHLKKKVRLLKLQSMPSRPQPQTPVDIETLANVAIHLNDPEAANNSTDILEPAQDAEASEDQP